MPLPRLIPCLDVAHGRVVKGVSFVDLRDVGDPVELANYYSRGGADELVLLASELATNAIMHTKSGGPDATFTLRAEVHHGDYVRMEVEDQGGGWLCHDGAADDADPDEHGRGLAIVEAIAGDENWGIRTGAAPESCVVWVRLAWREAEDT